MAQNLSPAVTPEAQAQMLQLVQMENQEKERHHMSMLQSKSQEHQMKLQEGQQKQQLQQQKMEMEYMKSSQGQQRAHEQSMQQQQQSWQSQEYEKLRASNEKQQSEQNALTEKLAKQRMDYEKERDRINDELTQATLLGEAKKIEGAAKKQAEISKKIKDHENAMAAAQMKYQLMVQGKVGGLKTSLENQAKILAHKATYAKDLSEQINAAIADAFSNKMVDPQDETLVGFRGPRNAREFLREGLRLTLTGTTGDKSGDSGITGIAQNLFAGLRTVLDPLVGDTPALTQALPGDQVADSLFDEVTQAIVNAMPDGGDSGKVSQFLKIIKETGLQANAGSSPGASASAKAAFQKSLQELGLDPSTMHVLLDSLDTGLREASTALKQEIRALKQEATQAGDDWESGPRAEALKSLEGGLNLLKAVPTFARAASGGMIVSPDDEEETLATLSQIVMQAAEPQEAKAMLESLKKSNPTLYRRMSKVFKDSGAGDLESLYGDFDRFDRERTRMEQLDDSFNELEGEYGSDMAALEAEALRAQGAVYDRQR